MKSRRKDLDRDAKRLMGMSGVEVYECHDSFNPATWYYDIVWRGRRRWSVSYPWEPNRGVLEQVGFSLRYKANAEEEFEKNLKWQEKEEADKERTNADDHEVMVRDCKRTLVDKPLYFYDK